MPAKNTLRQFEAGGYYHIYNRGAGKQAVFIDGQDKDYFLKLIARYLDPKVKDYDGNGGEYPKVDKYLELLAFCLMKNHFHLLIFIDSKPETLSKFMKSLTTSYAMYFNLRYKQSGILFQGRYRCSRISKDSYLQHVSRYIHLNPRYFLTYKYSSLNYYLNATAPRWLKPFRMLNLFEGADYLAFIKDYKGQKAALELIKSELADK